MLAVFPFGPACRIPGPRRLMRHANGRDATGSSKLSGQLLVNYLTSFAVLWDLVDTLLSCLWILSLWVHKRFACRI